MDESKKDWFQEGRGNVSGQLAKSASEILSQESETAVDISTGQEGKEANDYGAKPIYANGSTPFQNGRGSGRGR